MSTPHAHRSHPAAASGSTASRPGPGPAHPGCAEAEPARLVTQLVQRLHQASALPGPAAAHAVATRVLMLDAPSRRASAASILWDEPGLLGGFLGKGHFHRAFAIDQLAASGERVPGRWMALIASDEAHQPAARAPGRLAQALKEHGHARQVSAAAPQLMPGYAGMAAILAVDPSKGLSPALRYATVWERQDATFQEIVDQGGVAGGARVRQRAFAARDVARSMLLIGRAYQGVHAHDMVYTDPKPANLAFSIAAAPAAQPPPGPAPASPHPAPAASAAPPSRRGRPPGVRAADAPAGAMGGSMVGEVVFIDAESLQPPGYARDPAQRAVAILTPPMAAEEILRGVALGGGQALKRAQANAANDVFHTAVIAYGLVTGEVPQLALGKQRYQRRCDELRRHGGFDAKEAEQVMVDEFRLTRLLDGYDHEQRLLQRQVSAGTIPASLAQVLTEGLEGRITSLEDWERRTLAIPGAAAW